MKPKVRIIDPEEFPSDTDENLEIVPLTPRDSAETTESFHTHATSSYLHFFRSDQLPSARSHRSETPLCPTSEQRHSVLLDEEEDGEYEDLDDISPSPRKYVPTQYMLSEPPRHRTPASCRSLSSVSSACSVESSRLSILSSASHLFGESIVNFDQRDIETGSVASSYVLSPGRTVISPSSRGADRNIVWWREMSDNLITIARGLREDLPHLIESVWPRHYQTRLPLSPRSRNLADINFLTSQHKSKVQALVFPEEEYFDFCLVLKPQETYAFWASLLDFRVEILGQERVDQMNEALESSSTNNTRSSTPSSDRPSTPRSYSDDGSEARDVVDSVIATPPTTGMHRRRANVTGKSQTTPGQSTSGSPMPTPYESATMTRSKMSMVSPGLYSVADSSRVSQGMTRLSMFERAIHNGSSTAFTPESCLRRSSTVALDNALVESATPNTVHRRRWGNHTASQTPNMMSPPIRSLTRGSSTVRRSTTIRSTAFPSSGNGTEITLGVAEKTSPRTVNEIRIEDIPNQVIPRGIAAHTNGMLHFLSALKRGIVVRRHRPGKEAVFSKIVSSDGGDTIQYIFVEKEDGMNAFKEQRVRYNNVSADEVENTQPWSYEQHSLESDTTRPNHDFSVPDYVAAKQYREKMRREEGLRKNVKTLATKVVRSGAAKAADIIAVHPGQHEDPRSSERNLGSTSLRRSNCSFSAPHTFSLVLRTSQSFGRNREMSLDEWEQKWYSGEGNESLFRYVDIEAATKGEYWLLFRGFLLLHRDAAVGRFAEQRAAGIGSHYSRLEVEQREQADLEAHNRLHRDEFHEPVTVGCLEKLIVKWRQLDTTYMEGFTMAGALPPPSDYFLGFKSAGTSIWSRLRQAGLETQRVYSLDPRRVLIKVRCPSDRLMDVAEVLKLKLRSSEGGFAPFREDMMDMFKSTDDLTETPHIDNVHSFHFRSSIRQSIIDFIISSRIRDSGAELGQTTDVGKMIQSRVPLHMRAKVNSIYQTWTHFWKEENWTGRDGCSLSHESFSDTSKGVEHDRFSFVSKSTCDTESGDSSEAAVPHLFVRIFKGCFYQPLDSIEQYFGEKVAFYFAWLQHTAGHLVWLSIFGFIMFLLQVGSGSWDHPLRPFYSVMVMIWTFTVLINWKKRANYLAYRWGTLDYKEQETTRPEFKGDYMRDEVTGEWVVTYPKWKRWVKYSISFPLTLLFTAGSLVLILWVHANRDLTLARYLDQKANPGSEKFQFNFAISAIGKEAAITDVQLSREHILDPTFWFITIGMPALLGLCQPLLNLLLMKLSLMLNDFENYRTESEYRTYLIIKVISFRFVCYFAHLYYYAFVSVGSTQAIENGILRVGTGVFVYTTVAHWWQIFLQIYFPILIRKLRMYYRDKRLCEELRDLELDEEEVREMASRGLRVNLKERQVRLVNKRLLVEQAQDDIWLEVMLPEHNSFPEYIQAVVLFTYVSCFSAVLPITPLIVLFNYLVSMRLDAFKVCKGRRRPLAEKTGGIGIWEHVLHIVAVISVLTNCWMMGFTNALFVKIGESIGEVGLFAIIVAWEHVMLLIKYVMETSISPLPKIVKDAIKREQFELDQQRNTSMRLRQGRRSQHDRESVGEDRTQGVWRNVPSIGRASALHPIHSEDQESVRSVSRALSRAPTLDLGESSIEQSMIDSVRTPKVGKSDVEQGLEKTLFSA